MSIEEGQCPICPKRFDNRWGLTVHISKIHRDRPLHSVLSQAVVPIRPDSVEATDTLNLRVLPLVVVYDPATGKRGLLEWQDD